MEARPKLVSASCAAEIFGIDVGTLRNWHKRGLLRSYRTAGGHRRFDIAAVRRLRDKWSGTGGADRKQRQ